MYDATLKKRQEYQQKFSADNLDIDTKNLFVSFQSSRPTKFGSSEPTFEISIAKEQDRICFKEPLFFENTDYQFSFEFNDQIQEPKIIHQLTAVNDAFNFNGRNKKLLIGNIKTANDIGWFTLPIQFIYLGKVINFNFSFEVLPTKIDIHRDLPVMYDLIDNQYPLWRFSFAQKTEQQTSKGQKRGNLPLMWVAYFSMLRQKLEMGLKIIANSPHSRLKPTQRLVKADRIRGKLSYKLNDKIIENIQNQEFDKRYPITKKKLSHNTPENQFVKMIANYTLRQLRSFEIKIHKINTNQRISKEFLSQIKQWQKPISKFLATSFVSDVDDFKGTTLNSLVLQQKTGYNAVYQVWQELKYYLDLLNNQTTISMKTISEIYEVWCFLQLKQILIEHLDFTLKYSEKEVLKLSGIEYQLKNGKQGGFHFVRKDGVEAILMHEREYDRNGNPIKSHFLTQKPDITLQIKFPNHDEELLWLFDAKYRIKFDENDKIDSQDLVPDDAINQMHRYRDAIIYERNSQKSRLVVGAFALYPTLQYEYGQNIYEDVIKEVGIGAFPLLPLQNNSQDLNAESLIRYLKTQIGMINTSVRLRESIYLTEPPRIHFQSMNQTLYKDLLLIANQSELVSYDNAFSIVSIKKIHPHILREIRFIAIGIESSRQILIKNLFAVKNFDYQSEFELANFTLENPIALPNAIINDTSQVRIFTQLAYCLQTNKISGLETVYNHF